MAQASHRITHFPGTTEPHEPVAALPEELISHDRDPTREIRNLIDDLQRTAAEARRMQRQAEEEREQLRDQIFELENKLESERNTDARIKALTREKNILAEQQAQYGPVIADLNSRLKAAEAESREASTERNAAEREKKQALRKLEEAEGKRDEAFRQKEAANRQRELAREERDEAMAQAAAAKKNFTDAQKALAEARNEVTSSKKKGESELSGQLASLRQARDGMAAQIKQLQATISELQDQIAENSYARDAAEMAAEQSKVQLAELRETLEAAGVQTANAERFEQLEAEVEQLRQKHSEEQIAFTTNKEQLRAEMQALQVSLDAALKEKDAIAAALDEARTSLAAAREQVDAIVRDRDTLKKQLGDTEAKCTANSQLQSQFDQRRLDMIELTAQLENAHREIRNLSASLAEARLQAKLAARTGGAAAPTSAHPQTAPASHPHEPACREEILAMRRCFQTFSRDQKEFGMLNELETYTLKIGDEAMEQGRPILHRVAVAFASLLTDLLEVPDQITQATLRTINQTIEFIALQLADPEIEGRINLKESRVYIVDDDQNTCLTIVDSLNLVGLRASFALYSSSAVAELAGNHYDLIILDVHLPDINGFELCTHIRTMALHAETPIFFVTGDASLENRVKSSLRGGNEFIAKPFSIQEIALKALKSVISSQLKSR